ncbi:MAG: DUF177 domain-containing protein [Planctomycetota bacterium]|nr:MAG: DUF177 domain-containing protein [Planctomycetota bacterium]
MRKINIQELEKGPVYLQEERPPHQIDTQDLPFRIEKNVWIDLEFRRQKKNIFALGSLRGEMITNCARCLAEFILPVQMRIQVRFCPKVPPTSTLQELSEQDLDVCYYEKDFIDVDAHIRENFLLSLPIKPLCQEDCAGLCQSCGQNLNLSSCTCAREKSSLPSSRLGNLLKNLDFSKHSAS